MANMPLSASYQRFLAQPTAEALAPDAAIHYLPSSSSINEPPAILKHLSAQAQQLKKKENFLNVIEGDNSLCVEAETTLEFQTGGGTYLPGLDDNFLADRTVTIPVIHIVTFDGRQKIQQIRLMWDQGSLLKTVDVIGSRGKNWPLSDGKDQIKNIVHSIDAASSSGGSDRQSRRQSRGGANADKHTSLNLFGPRDNERGESSAQSMAPRVLAKPQQRDYHDLFAAGANLPNERSSSPSKGNPSKGGAGKHYTENRLFDSTPIDLTGVGSPEKISIKTNPKKYNHFDFGHGDDDNEPRPTSSKHSKHAPQWNFEDFVTPEKPREKKLLHNERNFGWSDDEEEASKPMVHRPHVPQARPDAEPHFEFNDESTPKQNDRRPKSRGNEQQMGLYEDHIHNNDDANTNSSAAASGPAANEKMPLGNITNVNNKGHNKNFSSQFDMSDSSPAVQGRNENISENRKKAASGMQANWESYDESPKDRETKPKGINIQGDGMGSRKGGEKSWWEYEDND